MFIHKFKGMGSSAQVQESALQRSKDVSPVETGRNTESGQRHGLQAVDGVRAGSSMPTVTPRFLQRWDHQLYMRMRMSEQRTECTKREGRGVDWRHRIERAHRRVRSCSAGLWVWFCQEHTQRIRSLPPREQSVWWLKRPLLPEWRCVCGWVYRYWAWCPVINAFLTPYARRSSIFSQQSTT